MSQIIQPSLRESVILGGRTITDPDNLVMLIGYLGGSAAYTTMRKPEASAGYAVPVGKTFRILAVSVYVSVANAGTGVYIFYGDTDVGQMNVAAPTNPVYPANGNYITGTVASQSVGASLVETAWKWDIATGKYPAIRSDGAGYVTVKMWGKEI